VAAAWGLTVTEGSASHSFMPLDQPLTTIGRSSSNRLVVDDEMASREHARIVSSGSVHTLYDLGSANGTLVNGQPVTQRVLQIGDRITVGSVTLTARQI
jgi:pSer/pThr/pTyr-binding forkhead associated (FHA) protein